MGRRVEGCMCVTGRAWPRGRAQFTGVSIAVISIHFDAHSGIILVQNKRWINAGSDGGRKGQEAQPDC